ncbi:uncharacterized protein LOC130520410 [Takifugu flavidus]|uniref:uncharacterized protein LOC130520410 n=1 Tax=Takifugu flavidus TaxID=433684 RepID=UPI002544119F|nr:uncharacterized protein LOC130520410 [Takifugu flavidus]
MTPKWLQNAIKCLGVCIFFICLFLFVWYLWEPPGSRLNITKIRHGKRSVNNNNLKDQGDGSSISSIAPQVCLPSNTSTTVTIPFTSLSRPSIFGRNNAAAWKDYPWYVTTGSTSHAGKWANLVADPKGHDWRSWSTNPIAQHQRKLLKVAYDDNKFVITVNLTGNNTLNPPGSSKSNTCWVLLFWAWIGSADVDFPVTLCQLPPQSTNGSEKIEPKLSPVARGRGIKAITSKLDVDDWFLAYTGISRDINNWLLLAEQAANVTREDCVVCLGPRPILKVIPSPVSADCVLELMTKTNPNSLCQQWDSVFPLTKTEKEKPIFSNRKAPGNFTCVHFTGGIENLGNLSSHVCMSVNTLNQSRIEVVSRSDIWWWCGDERLFDTLPRRATGLCALVTLLMPISVFPCVG